GRGCRARAGEDEERARPRGAPAASRARATPRASAIRARPSGGARDRTRGRRGVRRRGPRRSRLKVRIVLDTDVLGPPVNAAAAGADVLATGDRKHLLPVGEHRSVRLLTPQAVLAELRSVR